MEYPEDWEEIKYRLKEKRGYRCQGCGQLGNIPAGHPTKINPLNVHHLDQNPANNSEDNLLILCRDCHLRMHQGTLPSLLKIKAGQLKLKEAK